MKGDTCKQICDPKRDDRFSWSQKGSKYCEHCDVLIIVDTERCPCCNKLLGKGKRDYVKKADRN